jgi:methylase of polypeptide subunit release factors
VLDEEAMMDITASYSRNDFISFLTNSFLPNDFEPGNQSIYTETARRIKSAEKLGYCQSLDLSVYEFKHESPGDPRVTLSRESFKIIETNDTVSNVLAVFCNEDSLNWRLSLITSDYSLGKNTKQVKREFSNPRRFSWILGKDCKRHTPETMLFSRGKVNSIEELSSRFAIDTVTKKFYEELFTWYDKWAVNVVKFPDGYDTKTTLPKNPDVEANRQHLIRLITRLIFVWFIKQKDLIPEWIFDEKEIKMVLYEFSPHSAEQGNYYNGILQNLFFATLNKAIEERCFVKKDETEGKEDYGIKTKYRDFNDTSLFSKGVDLVKYFETVPFLNGGLFECLDRKEGSDKQHYVDGFSREKNCAAFVPNCLFFGGDNREGIIELFNRYNFTVEENTPQDIDIALDPELLGKVFENLLGTYNEETKSTARNESGSFYTPREIVDYMVDTSLKEYFKGKLSIDYTNLPILNEKIDKIFSYFEDSHDFSHDEVKILMNAIQQCKILDPACGSGAFPMGILNKLVFILEKLDPDNKLWEEIQIQKAKEETEEAFRIGDKRLREERLKEISDVFELNKKNYGRKLFLIENCIYGVDIQPIAVQISKLRFFISLIVDQKTDGTKENNYNVLPLPNLETKFVAANTLIGIKREQGVLADPAIEVKQEELLIIRHKHFSARKADEKIKLRKQDEALSRDLAALLKEDGFYNSTDAQKMADWNPYNQTKPSDFFDAFWMFGVKDGFDVVIGNPPYVRKTQLKEDLKEYLEKHYVSAYKQYDLYLFFNEFALKILKVNGIFSFIQPNKFLSSDYGIKLVNLLLRNTEVKSVLNVSLQKVFNAAVYPYVFIFRKNDFNIDINCTRTNFIEKCHRAVLIGFDNNEKIFAILEKLNSKSIKLKYIVDNIRRGLPNTKIVFSNNGKYYGIKSTLLEFPYYQPKTDIRFDYNLIHEGKEKIKEFAKKMILLPRTILRIRAIYKQNDNHVLDRIYYFENTNKDYLDIFILAALNSKITTFYYDNVFGSTKIGGGYIDLRSTQIQEFIIPKVSINEQKPFIDLVDKILAVKTNPQADISMLERQIDNLVYRLYNLTYDEVKVIEPNFPLGKEEYEGLR